MWRVGVDVGGTFTDIAVIDDVTGRYWVGKVPTSLPDPDVGIVEGLRLALDQLALAAPDVGRLAHGTTLATNALIERRGARTALVTTQGMGDVLELRRGDKPSAYDFHFSAPVPLVPRDRCFEVAERIDRSGSVISALTEADVERVLSAVRAAGVEAAAVALVYSYLDPVHERRVVESLRRALPEVFVYMSSEVDPHPGEFERMSTTVANAYIGPVVHRYLDRLSRSVAEIGLPNLRVMQSNGGLAATDTVQSLPVSLISSGPAAAVVAAKVIAERCREPNAIMCDMGGTSFDLSVISQGTEQTLRFTAFDCYPVRTALVDTHSIGAGGGSIAWVDSGNTVRIGPESARSWPGPACYGRGGTRPTITDADLVLGHFPGDALMAGAMPLDRAAAERAVYDHVAQPLGVTLVEAAAGILRIVDAAMANAIRVKSTGRGLDPRDFALVVGGGAGPLHVGRIARELDIDRILVPPHPGAMSAFGVAVTDTRHDASAPLRVSFNDSTGPEIEETFSILAKRVLVTFQAEGIAPDDVRLEYSLDLRYTTQANALTLALPGSPEGGWIAPLLKRFGEEHEGVFGIAGDPSQVSVARAEVVGRSGSRFDPASLHPPEGDDVDRTRSQDVFFPESNEWIETAVIRRAGLKEGDQMAGPCLIPEPDSTTLILPGQQLTVLDGGTILVTETRS
ncbi:MAG: hydantoinase/oxoprolinase family protein [Acidimicrobiales bacterium]|nr:hydantoinase/oxoprolinase family protein [Acidimicrobiales bacterium]